MQSRKIKLFYILFLPFFVASFFLPPRGLNVPDEKFYLAGLAVSDTNIGEQWHLEKIGADAAWEKTQGSGNVVVAVIDTGIDLNHPELANNIWLNSDEIPDNGIDDDSNGYIDDVRGWDFVENDNLPEPNLANKQNNTVIHHGTAVAGIIAAEGNNAFGGVGVSWRTKIMPLKVFDETGESNILLVGNAIEYAIREKADIINMSFVGLTYSEFLEQKIKAAYQAGILMVAAAGKENGTEKALNLDESKVYPICHDGPGGENWILGVAATDRNDKKTVFSNYGKNCVDISAPGSKINSALFQDASNPEFKSFFGGGLSGTSMAAPQVSGAAALLKALYPNYTNQQLTQVLLNSVDNIDSANSDYIGLLGKGRLNVHKAVSYPVISMETEAEQRVKYVLFSGALAEPKIWYFDAKGEKLKEFYAFSPAFRGGVNIAVGDIDNDGAVEVVAGAGAKGGPHIRIFDLSGNLKYQFFAFPAGRRNGVKVAVADTDGDGKKEIIAMEESGAKPMARIFDKNGEVIKDNLEFSKNFTKGFIGLAAGDVNYDGRDEIIAAASGRIKTMDIEGKILGDFAPFGARFSGAINIAAGDLNKDGSMDIIVNKAGSRLIDEYSFSGRRLSPEFYGFDKYGSIANIASGDIDGDGRYEIAATGKNGEVKIWNSDFNLKTSFYPFGKNFKKGLNVFIITR